MQKVKPLYFFLLILDCCVLFSCGEKKQRPDISFYFWRTDLKLKANERNALKENAVQQLYVRYFDIVYNESLDEAVPESPISFRDSINSPIIPVVFIKNIVFQKLDSIAVKVLAHRTYVLLAQMNISANSKVQELQFDCDWTEKTRDVYFYFLSLMKAKLSAHLDNSFLRGAELSATIRLHQIKYATKQGIPPVDKGVLMFYNMGKINSGEAMSIYDRNLSLKYLSALKTYPLKLDFALPAFAWGIHLRNGKVVQLLNKMDSRDFEDKIHFKALGNKRFLVANSFFKNGFYLKQNDEVKVEEIADTDFEKMAEDVQHYYGKPVNKIIFYDLDSINISRYEQDIFKKTADHF